MFAPFRRLARWLVNRAAPLIPLRVYQRLLPRSPIGFFYHTVSDDQLPHVRHLYPYKSPAAFEADLAWLHANTTLVDYPTLIEIKDRPDPGLSNAAFLSFDDGFVECYTTIRPILKKYAAPGLFFLTTDWIDNRALFFRGKISLIINSLETLPETERTRTLAELADEFGTPPDPGAFYRWLKRHKQSGTATLETICLRLDIHEETFLTENKPYMTRDQILEMQAEGFHFGAHSQRHAKFNTLTPDDQVDEILESCRIVAEITGKPSVPFAFPFSGSGVDRAMLREIRKKHAVVGPIFDTGKLRREPGIHHRIWVDKPVHGVGPEGNLEFWLHDAYVRLLQA